MEKSEKALYRKEQRAKKREEGRCIWCGGTNDLLPKIRCSRCVTKHNSGVNKGRRKKHEAGLCTHCGKLNDQLPKGYCSRCTVQAKEWNRRANRKLKVQTLAAYGGAVCVCCGETQMEFLTLDHVNGDGAAHRKRLGMAAFRFYRTLRAQDYPNDPPLQILCRNCNWAKGVDGTCPHQLKLNEARLWER